MTDPTAAALRLAAIVEYSDDAIASKDLNGIVTSWNRAAERMFGWRADEIIGKPISILIPSDRLNEEQEVLARIRRGESVEHYETIRQRKDGSLFPISLTVSPIRTADGTVVGASKIARDISDRRAAEAALAASEAQQDELRRRLTAVVAASRVLFASPRLEDVLSAITGLAESMIPADGYAIWRFNQTDGIWEIARSAGISDAFAEQIVASYRSGFTTVVPFTEPMVVDDVGTVPLLADRLDAYRIEGIASMVAVPLNIGGSLTGTFVLYYRTPHKANDVEVQTAQAIANLGAAAITTAEIYDEQRRSREKATRAYRDANAANRAKDEFLAMLSHELRTPLNAVLGWTRMLRTGVVPAARIARAVEVIERNAEAQLRLVEDMLDLSRIITGNFRLDARPTRLADSINAAVETLMPAANAKEIAIKVEAGTELVIGDAARLQQVVWNLLSNAVKFTPKGGRVDVSVRRHGSTVELTVSDTGEGILPDVLPFVFDRFRQGDSGSTRSHAGLGLGLAIVKHIVEAHGGYVDATSGGQNKGATFRLFLPVAAALPAQPGGAVQGVGVGADGPQPPLVAGLRALVVDDDPDARDLLSALLQARGVRVRAASSVREALDAFEREVPDIVLSDLVMPMQDGYELIRSIRERPMSAGGLVPAIAVTAHARPEERARSLASGFQVHLSKPIDPLALFSAVERLAATRAERVRE